MMFDFLLADPLLLGALGLVVVVVLIVLGVPIAFSIFAVGFFGQVIFFDLGRASAQLFNSVFAKGMDLLLASIPLFVFMGQLIAKSDIGRDLYDCIYKWVGRLPGGIAVTGVVSGAGFGAVTGVSAAAVATMATVALPEMRRYNYDMKLATGSIASASTLAILIPPSLLMLIYGLATESSIGALFLAGIFPAACLTVSFVLYIVLYSMKNPAAAPRGAAFPWKERIGALRGLIPVAAIFTLIIGGIYSGLFTPSEAAGVGALAVLVYLAAIRRLTSVMLRDAVTETMRLTVMIFLILMAVTLLTSFLVLSGILDEIVYRVGVSGLPPVAIIGLIVVLYLLLGMILDGFGMLLLTLPVTFPIVIELGYDPIWFGILVTILVEIGLLTPPVGLNCYILKQVYPSVALADIFRGVTPFVIITMAWVLLFVLWPQVITWVL